MNKLIRISLVLALTGLILGGVYTATQKSKSLPSVAGSNTTLSEEITVKIADLDLDKGVSFQTGLTALEATRTAVNGELITQGENSDAYVVEIMGRTADKKDREYWELSVNGQSAMVGAGSLILKPGDTIEWKVSKF